MLHVFLSVALVPLTVSADAPLQSGTQLTYRGSVEPRATQSSATGGKAFDLSLWILSKNETAADVFWLVDERGRGEFPWSERFGRIALDARLRSAAAGPAVLYDRGDGRSVVPIALPLFVAEKPLAADAEFQEDKLQFHVDQAAKAAGRPAWQVSVRDPFGPKRVMMVDQQSPLLLAVRERVIMGRGEEYEMKLDLAGSEHLSGETLAALVKAAERIMALRGKLNLPAGSQEAHWRGEQLKLLEAELPALVELAAATPLEKLAGEAQRDLKLQAGRDGAIAELRAKFDGREVEDFSIKGFGDETLSRADLAGGVTVLHFWDYRDEPLKEPYGQVGYLDFMYHRRKPSGLKVYGVAVDGRLADEKTRGAAERSVRKLKAFMNLSYPVLLDHGPLVKQFGDPRLVGASLPLFVVIGPDQKIKHYHVGHYNVAQDQGLRELDDVVVEALKQK